MGTQNRVKKFKDKRTDNTDWYDIKHNKTKRTNDRAWKHYTDYIDNEPSRYGTSSNMA